ncbi:MAG TPA: TetR/AcrR family transcriptional regulator [Noviherbaspirillum sp.]
MTVVHPIKKRPGRPPAVENPRKRILEQAAQLFADKGYETASMADLARSMGVSKAAVFHYFQTKQQIYDAVILQALEGLARTVAEAVAREAAAPEKLRCFMTAHARYFEAHRPEFITMLVGFGGMDNTGYRDEAMRLRDQHERLLRDILAEGMASGAFRQADVMTTGRAVLSLLNWMVRWFKPGNGARAEDVARDYFDLLVGGLCGAAATTGGRSLQYNE